MSVLVSVPYLLTIRNATREPVVKFHGNSMQSQSTDSNEQSWQQLPTKEVAFESHKVGYQLKNCSDCELLLFASIR
jgi:hypothetical protein